jgi:hypothetical protein
LDLLADLKKGKRGAIAKTITIIENDQKEAKKILKKNFQKNWKLNYYWNYWTCRSWQKFFDQQNCNCYEEIRYKTCCLGN